MINTKSSMIFLKPKDTIKLGLVELDKTETYSKEEVSPEDRLYKYLCQLGEQHGHEKNKPLTSSAVKIHICQNKLSKSQVIVFYATCKKNLIQLLYVKN